MAMLNRDQMMSIILVAVLISATILVLPIIGFDIPGWQAAQEIGSVSFSTATLVRTDTADDGTTEFYFALDDSLGYPLAAAQGLFDFHQNSNDYSCSVGKLFNADLYVTGIDFGAYKGSGEYLMIEPGIDAAICSGPTSPNCDLATPEDLPNCGDLIIYTNNAIS